MIIIIIDIFVVSDIDECLNDPCLHDGNCSNTEGSYICKCVPEWTGNNCQTGNMPNENVIILEKEKKTEHETRQFM